MYKQIDEISHKFLDVSYSTNQMCDIYLPCDNGTFKTIVLIHGGAWLRGDKREDYIKPAILGFVNAGFAVVSVNFRFSTEAIYPAALNDCKEAIKFIITNHQKFHIDADKISILGYSVGANMAGLIGVDEEFKDKLKASVLMFGPYDFSNMINEFNILNTTPKLQTPNAYASKYVGREINSDISKLKALNPASYLKQISNYPAFYITHGTCDNVVPFTQSLNLANKLMKFSKNRVELKPLLGANHLDTKFFESKNLRGIIEFLDDNL